VFYRRNEKGVPMRAYSTATADAGRKCRFEFLLIGGETGGKEKPEVIFRFLAVGKQTFKCYK